MGIGLSLLIAAIGVRVLYPNIIRCLREKRVVIVNLLEGIIYILTAALLFFLIFIEQSFNDRISFFIVIILVSAQPLVYFLCFRRKLRPVFIIDFRGLTVFEKFICILSWIVIILLAIGALYLYIMNF
jgi:hypothetical protein